MILPGIPFGLAGSGGHKLVASVLSQGGTIGSLSFETGFSSLKDGDTCFAIAFRDGIITLPTNPVNWTSLGTQQGSVINSDAASGIASRRVIGSGFTTPVGVTFTNASHVACVVLRGVTSSQLVYSGTTSNTKTITSSNDTAASLPFSPAKGTDIYISSGGNTFGGATVSGFDGNGIDGATLIKELSYANASSSGAALVFKIDDGRTVPPEFNYQASNNNTDARTIFFNIQAR